VRFHGNELLGLGDRDLSAIRGKGISMVFQDPLSALTPVYTVGDQIAEAVSVHTDMSRTQAARRAIELLDLVGIPQPQTRARAFPHEFSGGMRQRVMIAMAMANDPDVIIADEPTTALDVTIQAQVLEVLKTAQRATGAAIVMITHDLGIIAGFADRVMVMYAGRPVETGSVDDLFYRPRMPYTLGLLVSTPPSGSRSPLSTAARRRWSTFPQAVPSRPAARCASISAMPPSRHWRRPPTSSTPPRATAAPRSRPAGSVPPTSSPRRSRAPRRWPASPARRARRCSRCAIWSATTR
jgi:ABC-type dipeptide/oligopeptide/nickel transport system ATPase component